ncbi:MAG TPA: hypothetical protein VNW93_00745 [Mycobacterium sp.]|jgi:hypothetical protein|nr:hypothetical protein [Mycobacterium sp.]
MTETSEDDKTMAAFARTLAEALMRYARERRFEDQKEIARLHHELCKAYREESEPKEE